MSKRKPLHDIDLMKLLIDPRRSRILELAADTPVTVNELAEKLGEVPSRVYYHVHKLEEAGLLKLAETRQHGNLIEKLYQRTGDFHLTLDPVAFGPHMPAVMKEFERVLVPGLRLVEHTMKLRAERNGSTSADDPDGPKEPKVGLTVSWEDLTVSQWRAKMRRISEDEESDEAANDVVAAGSTDESVSRFAFVVLSYRLEDAEALGLFPGTNPAEEE